MRNPESLFAPVWNDKCLAEGEPVRAVFLRRDAIQDFLDEENIIFLGLFRERPAFAVNVGNDDDAPFEGAGQFHDLRYLGSVLPADEANLVAHARALVLWHRLQKFCGRCGSETRAESGGNTRVCVSEDCGRRLFPRVDPAIIVLVSDAESTRGKHYFSWLV